MKDKTTAILLAIFTGFVGGHKFYLGETKKGFIYMALMLALYASFFISLYDAYIMLTMSNEEFNAKYNNEPLDSQQPQRITTPTARARETVQHLNIKDVGMYNMDKSKFFKDLYRKASDHQDAIVSALFYEFNYTIALACQGRLTELEYRVEDIESCVDMLDRYNGDELAEIAIAFCDSWHKTNAKALISFCKTADKIDQSAETRGYESVGQAFDRKALSSRTYMKHFEYFNDEKALIALVKTEVLDKYNVA